jgi:outer membrane protein assembly factor BamB
MMISAMSPVKCRGALLDCPPMLYVVSVRWPRNGGLAVRDGKLYVGSRDEQAVLVLDAETGQQLESISLPGVRHLAAGTEVYAASVRGVVRLRDRKVIIEASEMNLTGITVAPGGDIFVSDGNSHQIHRFTADGKLVATIGTLRRTK